MADFPNFGEGGDTPLGRQRFETMMREAIERDFNHPSHLCLVPVQRDVGIRRPDRVYRTACCATPDAAQGRRPPQLQAAAKAKTGRWRAGRA